MKQPLRILFLFVATLFAVNAYAGVNKKYIQRTAAGESVFFIDVQKMPGINGTKGNLKYDYTYAQPTDSVALLMSVVLDKAAHQLFCTATFDGGEYRQKCEIIYVKPKGDKFEYRLRIYMPFNVFAEMYASLNPLVISIDDTKGTTLSFGYKPNKWQTNSRDINTIIEIIKINTGKTE
ncbi:MAG: hypothetical protein K2J74_00220 [Muribaculaceae bacterium]|nr:hypothetical protein [Muribaculaceae bacterium]